MNKTFEEAEEGTQRNGEGRREKTATQKGRMGPPTMWKGRKHLSEVLPLLLSGAGDCSTTCGWCGFSPSFWRWCRFASSLRNQVLPSRRVFGRWCFPCPPLWVVVLSPDKTFYTCYYGYRTFKFLSSQGKQHDRKGREGEREKQRHPAG